MSTAVPSLDESLGAMLIGVIVSAVLFGVSLVQTFYYFTNYHKDLWYFRTLVILTIIFDTVHQILISHTMYHYVVTNYFNPASLENLVWSLVIESLFTCVTAALVQSFYTLRVWQLSKRNVLLTGGVFMLVLATAGCGIAWVVLGMRAGTFVHLKSITGLTVSINALAAGVDIIIASTLCVMLNNARTGFKKSDTIINRLILFIVNTGVLTSCFAVAALVSLLASPNSLIYASFYFCIGRLYSNSLLATLNVRKSISGHVDDMSYMLASIPPTIAASASSGPNNNGNISVRIDTTKVSLHDASVINMGTNYSQKEDEFSMQKQSSF